MRTAARWVSIVGHPFVMTALLVGASALQLRGPVAALRAVVLVFVVGLLPVAVLMVAQLRRGSWTNADASKASERPLLFLVGIVAVVAIIGIALIVQPVSFLVRGSLGVVIMLAACAVVTRWIKVSLHLAFAALAATTLLFLHSPAGWIAFVSLPAIAWSRVALRRHTLPEVAAGLVLGAAFGYSIVAA